jgi:hypothetical protein
MSAVTFFQERLRGSDSGDPTDRDSAGFDVRLIDFNGFVHVEIAPAVGSPTDSDKGAYRAIFSLGEGRRFVDAFSAALERLESVGEA